MNGPSALDPRLDCPQLETLAAFADGRLAGAERDVVIAHLADCEACREIVVEARTIAAAELASRAGTAAAGGEVVPFRKPARAAGRSRVLIAAAATLAVVVAGWFWLRAAPTTEQLLAELATDPQALARLGDDWIEPLWSVTRGEGPEVSEVARAFRLGVRSAGLDVALAAGDRRAARRFAAECALLVADVPLADSIAHLYREIARRAAEPAAPLATLASDATTAAHLAREAVDPALWQFGRWSESGRLVTAMGARLALPDLPALPPALPDAVARLARDAARPDLNDSPARRAERFVALVAAGGDLQ